MLSAPEVAKMLGRSQTYIKDHAPKLGGRKLKGRWAFPERRVLDFQLSGRDLAA